MRILAIDSSQQTVSVALLDRDRVVVALDSRRIEDEVSSGRQNKPVRGSAGCGDEMAVGFTKKRSKRGRKTSRIFPPGASVLLAPLIESAMHRANWTLEQVSLIAVTIGPGPFTGLRVGVVTAKTLAYAIESKIIGINTLELIAANTAIQTGSLGRNIRPVLNAQRNQLFSATFTSEQQWQSENVGESQILGRQAWIESLNQGDIVSGTGLSPIVETIKTECPDVTIAPEACWSTTAQGVGKLAWKKFESGHRDDLWTLEPIYFRPSSAEELRKNR